jgi:hypothetical protein
MAGGDARPTDLFNEKGGVKPALTFFPVFLLILVSLCQAKF